MGRGEDEGGQRKDRGRTEGSKGRAIKESRRGGQKRNMGQDRYAEKGEGKLC